MPSSSGHEPPQARQTLPCMRPVTPPGAASAYTAASSDCNHLNHSEDVTGVSTAYEASDHGGSAMSPRSHRTSNAEQKQRQLPATTDLSDFQLDAIEEGFRSRSELEEDRAGASRVSAKSAALEDEISDGEVASRRKGGQSSNLPRPPSFAESQFQTIIRRQRKRRMLTSHIEQSHPRASEDVTSAAVPLRSLRTATDGAELDPSGYLKVARGRDGPARMALNNYEFAGWGSMAMLEVTADEVATARRKAQDDKPQPPSLLGQWRAAAIAGNAVTGSIFYALPAVFAVSGVFTPVCLFLATLLMIPVLVVIDGLTRALQASNAGSYSYMLNVTCRTLALVAGAITFFDAVMTGAVSSATAATYASYEARHLSMTAFTVIFLVVLTLLCFSGLRDSSSLALGMFLFHLLSMTALLIAAMVAWARLETSTWRANWHDALRVAESAANLNGKNIARVLFDGTVVAFVGLTGFETTVAYAGSVRPGQFWKALRNIWVAVALMEMPIALLVIALMPFADVLAANNILASLAHISGGKALQVVVVVDAVLVLCGGILTSAITSSGVLTAMSRDGSLPRVLASTLRRTGAPTWCLLANLAVCIAICGTTTFSQLDLSSIFSISFLMVLFLLSLASLLLLYSRPRLSKHRTHLGISLLALAITLISIVGNAVLAPNAFGQALAYGIVLAALLLLWANRVFCVRVGCVWLPEQIDVLRRYTRLNKVASKWIRAERRRNRAVFMTSSDELSTLMEALLYIQRNEPSIGRVILVHCYESIGAIPTELEANHQLVDEAFPTITVDLVFIEAQFEAGTLELLSTRLGVPREKFFIGCPSYTGDVDFVDLAGTRIILE